MTLRAITLSCKGSYARYQPFLFQNITFKPTQFTEVFNFFDDHAETAGPVKLLRILRPSWEESHKSFEILHFPDDLDFHHRIETFSPEELRAVSPAQYEFYHRQAADFMLEHAYASLENLQTLILYFPDRFMFPLVGEFYDLRNLLQFIYSSLRRLHVGLPVFQGGGLFARQAIWILCFTPTLR